VDCLQRRLGAVRADSAFISDPVFRPINVATLVEQLEKTGNFRMVGNRAFGGITP
jgi:hypothetical protein